MVSTLSDMLEVSGDTEVIVITFRCIFWELI